MRGPVVLLAFVVVVILGVVTLGPAFRNILLGNRHRTEVKILEAITDDVPVGTADGETTFKLVLKVSMHVPMGRKPESLDGYVLKDWHDRKVPIDWVLNGTWEDHESDGQSVMVIKDVYLPPTFRKGKLYFEEDEMCDIVVPDPPYPADPKKKKKLKK